MTWKKTCPDQPSILHHALLLLVSFAEFVTALLDFVILVYLLLHMTVFNDKTSRAYGLDPNSLTMSGDLNMLTLPPLSFTIFFPSKFLFG